jgi:hypothetical protein
VITIGDGRKARFWKDAWLDGEAPMNLAPNLFALVTRKGTSVQQELQNNTWMNRLRNKISTPQHIEEFVSLWIRIQAIHLQEGVRDSITWRWTADGCYSTRTAYRIQFKGAYSRFNTELIWKADAENKCKVFMWILVQEKILTADNLQKRGWPHHEHCVLCNGPLETCLHLSFHCAFTKAVWNQVFTWEGFDTGLLQCVDEPSYFRTWWEETAPKIDKEQRRRFNGMVVYTCWNLWKERNRRILNNVFETAIQVAARTKDEISQRKRALERVG